MACKGGTFQNGEDKYYPNAYYKVGDLFLTTRSENPNLRFGGTWELYGKGKVLVCVDPDDSDFSAVKKTGGEKEHTLTIDEMPSHNHSVKYASNDTGFGDNYFTAGKKSSYETSNVPINNTGRGQSHNNMPPYQVVAYWKRIS